MTKIKIYRSSLYFFFALMYSIQWSKLKSKINNRFNKEKSQSHLMSCFICYDSSKVLPLISRPVLTTMRVKAKPHIWHMIYTHHNSFFFVFHSHNIKHNWCYNHLSELRRKKKFLPINCEEEIIYYSSTKSSGAW